MSHHRFPHLRLAPLAGLLALASTASAGVATPRAEISAAPAEAASTVACGRYGSTAPARSAPDACRGHGPGTYSYRTLDYPGSSQTILWGINDLGELTGQYAIDGGTAHAFIHRNGRSEPLAPDTLGEYFSAAGGPNDLGVVYGAYADAAGNQHGFRTHWGSIETVDFGHHLNSNVDGVTLFGTILGVYWDADGVFHGVLQRYGRDTPIQYPGSVDTYPLGINTSGESVGYWDVNPAQTHGFYRSANGRMSTLDVPGALATVAFSINDVGQIVGFYVDASGAIHGFVDTRGVFTTLDMPGAAATFATYVNNLGVVAGEYADTTGARHGMVAKPW